MLRSQGGHGITSFLVTYDEKCYVIGDNNGDIAVFNANHSFSL